MYAFMCVGVCMCVCTQVNDIRTVSLEVACAVAEVTLSLCATIFYYILYSTIFYYMCPPTLLLTICVPLLLVILCMCPHPTRVARCVR